MSDSEPDSDYDDEAFLKSGPGRKREEVLIVLKDKIEKNKDLTIFDVKRLCNFNALSQKYPDYCRYIKYEFDPKYPTHNKKLKLKIIEAELRACYAEHYKNINLKEAKDQLRVFKLRLSSIQISTQFKEAKRRRWKFEVNYSDSDTDDSDSDSDPDINALMITAQQEEMEAQDREHREVAAAYSYPDGIGFLSDAAKNAIMTKTDEGNELLTLLDTITELHEEIVTLEQDEDSDSDSDDEMANANVANFFDNANTDNTVYVEPPMEDPNNMNEDSSSSSDEGEDSSPSSGEDSDSDSDSGSDSDHDSDIDVTTTGRLAQARAAYQVALGRAREILSDIDMDIDELLASSDEEGILNNAAAFFNQITTTTTNVINLIESDSD